MSKKLYKTAIVLFILVMVLIIQPYRMVYVTGRSMEPSYKDGSLALSTQWFHDIKKGDVVMADLEGDGILIKRVAFLPGETYVEAFFKQTIPGYKNFITYSKVYDPHSPEFVAMIKKDRRSTIKFVYARVVPSDCYVLMGDNHHVSIDSRVFGAVPRANIIGRIVFPFHENANKAP